MTSNATGESLKTKGLISQVAAMKNRQFKMTKSKAEFLEMIPAGISLVIVRGFFLSISLSYSPFPEYKPPLPTRPFHFH